MRGLSPDGRQKRGVVTVAGRGQGEYVETLVIGGGQAGLATGYELSRRGLPHKIVDANPRVGDAWRNRWDSLRLFTPNRLSHLPGMRLPGFHWGFPTKNEFADYLESYARKFDLPIETGVRIDRLTREGGRFVATTGERRFEADNVVVAMSSWQRPRVPDFASDLDPQIVQFHSLDYKNPDQLQDGDVLVVGAGNSGAEIAIELARTHKVMLSGKGTGAIPFRPESVLARVLMPFIGRVVFHRVLTVKTPIGKKVRSKMIASGEPLIRVKPRDLKALGVERVPRVTGAQGGRPELEDGRVADVANIVWCTGFHPGFSWIDLPVLGPQEPIHKRGVVESEPGLYFIGLKFLYSVSSEQIHGVGRDADRIAGLIAARRNVKRQDRRAEDVPEPAARQI